MKIISFVALVAICVSTTCLAQKSVDNGKGEDKDVEEIADFFRQREIDRHGGSNLGGPCVTVRDVVLVNGEEEQVARVLCQNMKKGEGGYSPP